MSPPSALVEVVVSRVDSTVELTAFVPPTMMTFFVLSAVSAANISGEAVLGSVSRIGAFWTPAR